MDMNLRSLFVLSVLAWVSQVQAVSLSQNGRGQVLIHPYYTARGGNDTLFSVANTTAAGKAVRIRFREGRNSRTVLDFNLYLGPDATWTGAVQLDQSGTPVLRTWDDGCTTPQFVASAATGATEIPFTNANYANYDRAGSGLDRAREGFFEIIEMGEISRSFTLQTGKNFLAAAMTVAGDCAAIANAWGTGGAFLTSGGTELTVPTGGLVGMGMIINVAQGTDYSYDPVALSGVYSTSRHTAPGSASPNLADADPHSLILANDQAYASTWDHGIDAVSAVLMHQTAINEYITSTPTLDATTDLVYTFPPKSFYVVRESDTGQATRAPFAAKFDDMAPIGSDTTTGPLLADGTSTGACEIGAENRYARSGLQNYPYPAGDTPTGKPSFGGACWSACVLSLGNVLSSSNLINDPPIASTSYYTTFGRIEVSFPPFQFSTRAMVSKEGTKYIGLPMIGFAVQKYINGNLNGVLANYGATFTHKYITLVQ